MRDVGIGERKRLWDGGSPGKERHVESRIGGRKSGGSLGIAGVVCEPGWRARALQGFRVSGLEGWRVGVAEG